MFLCHLVAIFRLFVLVNSLEEYLSEIDSWVTTVMSWSAFRWRIFKAHHDAEFTMKFPFNVCILLLLRSNDRFYISLRKSSLTFCAHIFPMLIAAHTFHDMFSFSFLFPLYTKPILDDRQKFVLFSWMIEGKQG